MSEMNKRSFLSYQQPFSIKMSAFGFQLIARDLLWWITWLFQAGQSWLNKISRKIRNYSLRQSGTLYVPQKSITVTGCQVLTSHWSQFCKNVTSFHGVLQILLFPFDLLLSYSLCFKASQTCWAQMYSGWHFQACSALQSPSVHFQ